MRKFLSLFLLFAAAALYAGKKAPARTGVYVELTHSSSEREMFGDVEVFTLKFSKDFPLEHAKLIVNNGLSGGNSTYPLRDVGKYVQVGYFFEPVHKDREKEYSLALIAFCGQNKQKCYEFSGLTIQDGTYPKISLQKKVVLYPGVKTAFATWTFIKPEGNFMDLRMRILSEPWPELPREGLFLTLVIQNEELARRRGAVPGTSAGEALESFGVPADAIRPNWDHAKLDRCAADVKAARNSFYYGEIGLPELLDRELVMIEFLLRQPGIAASPQEVRLRREYLKRLQQQFEMCKAAYENGQASLKEVRQKKRKLTRLRKEWGLSD